MAEIGTGRVVLGPGLVRDMERAARAAGSREACGLLLGPGEGSPLRIRALRLTPNVARRPQSEFEVDPAVVLATLAEAERRGELVAGLWHSHPRGPSHPSQRDLEDLWPGWVLLISDGRRPGQPPRAFCGSGRVSRELDLCSA